MISSRLHPFQIDGILLPWDDLEKGTLYACALMGCAMEQIELLFAP